jgi:hypothetical protein
VGGFIGPVAEYSHAGGRCSITGGYVYRGAGGALPSGAYVYGDLCTGEILQLLPAAGGGAQSVLLDTGLTIASFGEDEAGELYVVGLGGTVDRLVASVDPGAGPPPGGDAGGGVAVSADGGGGGCFIATAAYGSPRATEVQALRRFRDRYLLQTRSGRLLVAGYNRVSPSLADWLRAHPWAKPVVRTALHPVVRWAEVALASPALAAGLTGGLLLLGPLGVLVHRARRAAPRGRP